MNRSKFLVAVSVVCSCLLLSGCNKTSAPAGMPSLVPLMITVTQDGAPLPDASVSLFPESGEQWSAVGATNASGSVQMYTQGRFPGVAEGAYKVTVIKTVSEAPAGAASTDPTASIPKDTYSLVEKKLTDVATTPLKITVTKATKTEKIDVGKAVREKIEL